MRATLLWKTALASVAIALILSVPATSWAARMSKPASGDCIFHRKIMANGRWCSYHCDRAAAVCAQQSCWNGHWEARINCIEPFCAARCGG